MRISVEPQYRIMYNYITDVGGRVSLVEGERGGAGDGKELV